MSRPDIKVGELFHRRINHHFRSIWISISSTMDAIIILLLHRQITQYTWFIIIVPKTSNFRIVVSVWIYESNSTREIPVHVIHYYRTEDVTLPPCISRVGTISSATAALLLSILFWLQSFSSYNITLAVIDIDIDIDIIIIIIISYWLWSISILLLSSLLFL